MNKAFESAQRAMQMGSATTGLVIGLILAVELFGRGWSGCWSAGGYGSGCGDIHWLWFSPLFVGAAVLGSAAAVILLVGNHKQAFFWVALALGGLGLCAGALMFSTRVYCPACMAMQLSWLAMALSVSGPVSGAILSVPPLGLALVGGFNSVGNFLIRAPLSYAELGWRAYEAPLRGCPSAVVIFTDPLSPDCRRAMKSFRPELLAIPALYRWKIQPESGNDGLRVAAFLQSALSQNPEKGRRLLADVHASGPTPAMGDLSKLALLAGFSPAQAQEWAGQPDPYSLGLIKEDGLLAESLGVATVPAVGYLCDSAKHEPEKNLRILDRTGFRALSAQGSVDMTALEVFFVDAADPRDEGK